MGGAAMPANLDDLNRLRADSLGTGIGSGRWIKCAQALMDSFPDYYATAKAMNDQAAEARQRVEVLRQHNATMQVALTDACDLLEGWVLTKCPKRFVVEHMQHIANLRKAGQL